MELGNFFPEETKRDYLVERLHPGRVLLLYCAFRTNPKDKYLIVGCTKPELLFLIINSRINQFDWQRPALKNCHVQILAKKHDFLNHDSFVNCNKAIAQFDIASIEAQIFKDMNRIKGTVEVWTRNEIIEAVKRSKALERRYKNWIVDGLEKA